MRSGCLLEALGESSVLSSVPTAIQCTCLEIGIFRKDAGKYKVAYPKHGRILVNPGHDKTYISISCLHFFYEKAILACHQLRASRPELPAV
jgi:hypothetical protein